MTPGDIRHQCLNDKVHVGLFILALTPSQYKLQYDQKRQKIMSEYYQNRSCLKHLRSYQKPMDLCFERHKDRELGC